MLPGKLPPVIFRAPLPQPQVSTKRGSGYAFLGKKTTRPTLIGRVANCALQKNLSCDRPLKHRRARPPQRIPAMRVRQRMCVRVTGVRDVSIAVTASRRRLGQASGITDRAEICCRHCADMIADRLQPLQDRLPLFPVELPQEWAQPLDEWIFEQRFAVRFRNE